MGEDEIIYYKVVVMNELSISPCEPPEILGLRELAKLGPDDIELTGRIVASRKKKSRRSDWWRAMRLIWGIDWRQERRSRRQTERRRRQMIKK